MKFSPVMFPVTSLPATPVLIKTTIDTLADSFGKMRLSVNQINNALNGSPAFNHLKSDVGAITIF